MGLNSRAGCQVGQHLQLLRYSSTSSQDRDRKPEGEVTASLGKRGIFAMGGHPITFPGLLADILAMRKAWGAAIQN